jgi:hypothetical protein
MFAALAFALTAAIAAPPADTTAGVTLADVKLPGTVEVAGRQLLLNGASIRKKSMFKVYVAGLYLTFKSSDANVILAADSARRMFMQYLRDVDKEKICDGWNEGLKDNTPNPSAQLTADFKTLCGYMTNMKEKEQLMFTYVPGTGTEVSAGGKVMGTIAGKEFADALLRAWIGPKPGPGESFKKDVLKAK